jgi:8-oxo-dGTP pyrophosphatase MutT (NUDIX family)
MGKKFNNTPNKCIISDGIEYWISRSVAVVALVNVKVKNKSYVLINKRGTGTPDFQGYWNLPCGYLDWDESGANAAKREIYEETGLDIDKYDFKYNEQPKFVITEKITNKQNVTLYYQFDIITSKETLFQMINEFNTNNSEKDEVADIKLIELNEVNGYRFCFNHDVRIKQLLTKKTWFIQKLFVYLHYDL